jgi:hypothetical protein
MEPSASGFEAATCLVVHGPSAGPPRSQRYADAGSTVGASPAMVVRRMSRGWR